MTLTVCIVGPCASGKSTLKAALLNAGYQARHPVQEHSHIKDMWRKRVDPDVLIFLDADYDTVVARRHKSTADRLPEQHRRLAHAREHADLYLDTSNLTIEEVRQQVLAFLKQWEQS